MSEVHEIKAILEDDMKNFLHFHGALSRIENGEMRCMRCNEKISMDNISSIHFIDGVINLRCGSLLCEIEI